MSTNIRTIELIQKAKIPYTTLAKIEDDVIQNSSIHTINHKIADGLEISLSDLIKEQYEKFYY